MTTNNTKLKLKLTHIKDNNLSKLENEILLFKNTLNKKQVLLFNNIVENVKKLEKQNSVIDELTGLYNRKGFYEIFNHNIKK